MAEIFENYISNFKLDNKTNVKPTHTSCGKPYGKYKIPDQELDKFYQLYADALNDGYKSHLTELRDEKGPLVIDIDFRQDLNHPQRYYTQKNIEKLVATYNAKILKYYDVSDKIQAFIFEKKKPNKKKDKIHDGIHIIYPYVCIKSDMRHLIRQLVMEKVGKKKYFSNIHHINSLEDIFDKGVVDSTNWLLYGSSKPRSDPYLLTAIYDYRMNKVDISEYTIDNLPQILSVRKFKNSSYDKLKEGVNINKLNNKLNKLNIKIDDAEINNELFKENILYNNIIKQGSESDILAAKELVEMLDVKRSEDYHNWIRVGWCLHNIDHSLLETWIKFSKKTSNQFKEGECEKLWRTFRSEGFGLGSLYHWAKVDNITKYLEYKKKKVHIIMNQNIDGSTYGIACILHEMYKDTFVCASLKHKTWYHYSKHRWAEIERGYTLHAKISTEVVSAYSKLGANFFEKLSSTNDANEKDRYLQKTKAIQKVIEKLKSTRFKSDIMTECTFLFYDKEFLNKLDEQRDLICFENGVYNLAENYFRPGVPDDYISLCTNINYVEYDEDNKYVQQVYNYFKQVQPKEDVREYVLTLLSSYLQGHTPDEKFHIWTGTGANSKSKCIELFQMGLGDYAGTLPISLLTQRRAKSGVATPEIAMTKGKRFCVFQEPEEDDNIRVGLMKELTGGDKIMARQLFKDPIEFKPQFKLLLTCNKLPEIPSTDGGTWRRLRVVEFGSKFVDCPKKPNEFEKDEYLSLRFEKWKVALMSILMYKFKQYKQKGLKEPKEVTKFTDQYQESSNMYLEFWNETIEITNKNDDYITLTSLYEIFKSWLKNGYSHKKVPNKREFNNYIKSKYKNIKKNYVYGIVYSCQDDPLIKNLEENC